MWPADWSRDFMALQLTGAVGLTEKFPGACRILVPPFEA
jgi:hypothetical protein